MKKSAEEKFLWGDLAEEKEDDNEKDNGICPNCTRKINLKVTKCVCGMEY